MTRSKKTDFGTPDSETPEWTKRDFARAVPLSKLAPTMQRAVKRAARGRPAGTAKKESVHISLDKDIAAKLRASGAGWQTRLNEMLRVAMGLLA